MGSEGQKVSKCQTQENYNNKITKAQDEVKKNEDSQLKKKAQAEAQKTEIDKIIKDIEGVK